MHGAIRSIILLMLLSFTSWGCGGSPNLLKEIPTTVNTVRSAKGYVKKVALALTQVPDTPIGQAVGQLYLETLDDAIRGQDHKILLLTSKDEAFEEIREQMSPASAVSLNATSLSALGSRAGYQGLISAGIVNIRPVARKTGIFWMRKTRYFIHYTVTVDLYDPYTAAKIISDVVEDSIKISEEDFETLKSGAAVTFEDLNETIADLARDHGEKVADALADHQWKTIVAEVADRRIYLSASSETGLQRGDRLAVFEGRRLLKSKHGDTYIIPGIQVGEIEITSVEDQRAEAKATAGETIREGDVAIPLK